MMSLAKSIVLGAAVALAAGCSSKPLQPGGGGSGGIGTVGLDGGGIGTTGGGGIGAAGGGIGTGGAAGGLFTGRRSFVVTSAITYAHRGAPTGAPSSHIFTMVVDGDKGSAILGAAGQGFVSSIEPTADGFRVAGPSTFRVPGSAPWFVSYTDLSFALDSRGLLTGNGTGHLNLNGGGGCNMSYTDDASMSVSGTPDGVAPVLALEAAGDLTDPFISFGVASSEPLPGQTVHPVLRAASGDTVAFAPSFTTPDTFVTAFVKPSIILRYGEQYSIDLSGMTDFASNVAVAPDANGLGFTTMPTPPMVAADGFESVVEATLGGAQVLSGAGDPVIDGTRSLYIPPGTSFTSPATKTQLALRLAGGSGKTVVRFAYRIVNPGAIDDSSFVTGSVGRSIMSAAALPAGNGATTALTIAGTQVELGPLMSAAINLPADATDEIVLERIAPQSFCPGFPSMPTAGIIIDDLRAE